MNRSKKRGSASILNAKAPDPKLDAKPSDLASIEVSTPDLLPVVDASPNTHAGSANGVGSDVSVAAPSSAVGCRSCELLLQNNHLAFERLLDEIARLRNEILDCIASKSDYERNLVSVGAGNPEQIDELLWQIRQRDEKLAALERERESLERQNQELASKLASQNVRKSVQTSNSSANDALSWEDRKKLILQQLESDTFDTEAFVSGLQSSHNIQSHEASDGLLLDPVVYIEQLCAELERRNVELKSKNDEIGELRCLLEQHGGAREGGLAVGAAAIAQMMDSDELVREERERLQQLQAEWEEKFRKGEIEASLERAKLSRERQELAKREAELEEQVEHMKRELRLVNESSNPGTGSSRRWLQKLGLGDPKN
jgi:hypothetical protein